MLQIKFDISLSAVSKHKQQCSPEKVGGRVAPPYLKTRIIVKSDSSEFTENSIEVPIFKESLVKKKKIGR
jgi:hypothetical protein